MSIKIRCIYELRTASVFLLTYNFIRSLILSLFINKFGYYLVVDGRQIPIKYNWLTMCSIFITCVVYAITLSGLMMKKSKWLILHLVFAGFHLIFSFTKVVCIFMGILGAYDVSYDLLKLSVVIIYAFELLSDLVIYLYYKDLKKMEKNRKIVNKLLWTVEKRSPV